MGSPPLEEMMGDQMHLASITSAEQHGCWSMLREKRPLPPFGSGCLTLRRNEARCGATRSRWNIHTGFRMSQTTTG